MANNYGSNLLELLELARKVTMTAHEKEEQRISFAYGNARIENEYITRDSIRRSSEELRAAG